MAYIPTMANGKIIFVVFLLTLCGCDISRAPKQAYAGRTIVVFVDRSASAKNDQDTYTKAFEIIIASLKLGDRIVIGSITDKSEQDFKAEIDSEAPDILPEQSWSENDIQHKKKVKDSEKDLSLLRETIKGKIQHLLTQSSFSGESAIFQSLHIAQQIFSAERGRRKILVLLSDMLEDSGNINLEKDTISDRYIQAAIERHRKSGLISDLKDVSIYIAGAHAQTMERTAAVERFWRGYFKETGATIGLGHYSRTMPPFEK